MSESRHPIQPFYTDKDGTLRFKENAIVRYLLDEGRIDMNAIARLPFNADDRQQFAQLIGYSLCGYGELTSYVDDEAYGAAARMADAPVHPDTARADHLRELLDELREKLREPIARLYEKHPDDFGPGS